MVGQGVLRECLLAPDVGRVLSIVRTPTGRHDVKLQEIVHRDIANLLPIESELQGLDACFFCLGVSSVGMTEAEYRRITFDLTTGAAGTLVKNSPQMTFVYVSGAGTDSTEKGRIMWARVKGATENALLRMPFKAAYMFRPGGIQPMHGERPKAALVRIIYAVVAPLAPWLTRVAPGYVTTTERMGRAMLNVVRRGAAKRVLESADINLTA